MNNTLREIAELMAKEEAGWKDIQVLQTANSANVAELNELVKLGWCFGLQREGIKNVLMWGKVDAEQNFVEESRFKSKIEKEFNQICREAIGNPRY